MNLLDEIIRFENMEMEETEILALFAQLIRTGLAWQLQGSYGRAATLFIQAGIISEDGEVLG